MQNNVELNEKFEELKKYLIESTQFDTSKEIKRLSNENKKLREENELISKQNDEFQTKNKVRAISDMAIQIIVNRISETNVYKIIESLFTKTFTESKYEAPLFWSTYVNYYNDRKDVVSLLRFAGVKIPDELESIILPHEWNEELLDKFFDTMSTHYNCNGTMYQDNLRFWTYQMAAHPFDNEYFTCYDEIPWQFVLRNPLLNSQKYAVKIAEEMNKGDHGIFFSKICVYQELNHDVLQTIIDNLKVPNNRMVIDFLTEHVELVTDKKILNKLFLTFSSNKYGTIKNILRMPQEYQEKYVKSLDNPEKMINFLNLTKFSKEKRMELLGNIFE